MSYLYNCAACGRSGFGRKKLLFPGWEQNYVSVISGVPVLLSDCFSVISRLFPDPPYRQATGNCAQIWHPYL